MYLSMIYGYVYIYIFPNSPCFKRSHHLWQFHLQNDRHASGHNGITYLMQGYILCKILWPGGGGNGAGEKMKNEAVGNKMKKKEKGERKKGKGKRRKGKGESDFFFNIWHTFVDNCILT